jgi:signal peptidase I
MKIFGPLYARAIQWAQHRHAPRLLAGLSFIEAFIFPVAPEVMLAPMTLAKPQHWARYAGISLACSMLGVMVGYALGHYAFEAMRPLLAWLGWLPGIDAMVAQLRDLVVTQPWKAFWLLVAAGFIPIPLKIFTWASGIVGMPMLPFIGGTWKPFRDPQPGDVVVFEFPQDPSRDFIKRVIAVPGQTVEVREGRVYVDGTVVDEPYLSEPPHYAYGPTSVPPGQFFVLGDNRNNSYDSHSWGMLPDERLIGRAEFRYWPLSAAGRIDSHPILEASDVSGQKSDGAGGSASP